MAASWAAALGSEEACATLAKANEEGRYGFDKNRRKPRDCTARWRSEICCASAASTRRTSKRRVFLLIFAGARGSSRGVLRRESTSAKLCFFMHGFRSIWYLIFGPANSGFRLKIYFSGLSKLFNVLERTPTCVQFPQPSSPKHDGNARPPRSLAGGDAAAPPDNANDVAWPCQSIPRLAVDPPVDQPAGAERGAPPLLGRLAALRGGVTHPCGGDSPPG